MRPWIRRLLDWLRSDVNPLSRSRPSGQAIHTRYEKAGLVLYDLPIPWNADAVVVEVLLRPVPPSARKKLDYSLRFPGRDPITPESLRIEADDRYRLVFRLPVPSSSLSGELLWKQKLMGNVSVPVLTVHEFLLGLKLALPTASVKLGTQSIAAQTFVSSQCTGLIAACVLRSPTNLSPIADLGLKAVFVNSRTKSSFEVPVTLSSSQLAGREAIVTALSPRYPKRVGEWTIAWRVANREVASYRLIGIPARRFDRSLRVSDSRFVSRNLKGTISVTKHPPTAAEVSSLGPCFLIASSEMGIAGVCQFQVCTVVSSGSSNQVFEGELLVTDGPALFAPGMIDASELVGVTGFELKYKGKALGIASLSPVPAAVLNSEGGFKPPPDFVWSSAAEDELSDRLGRLLGGK